MAESFLFSIAEGVLGKLSSAAIQEIGLAWGVEKELNDLEDTLSTIKAVLLDAEKKQGKSHELRVWMERLEDVCHDLGDVLDEFEIVDLKQIVMQKSVVRKVPNFFSRSNSLAFRIRMGHKIKEIRERLGKIADDKAKFHLTEQTVDKGHRAKGEMQRLASLQMLLIPNCERLLSLSRGVAKLVGLKGLLTLTLQQYILVQGCPNFTKLPEWMENLKSLLRNPSIDIFARWFE
ncbi:hypothetical protein F0562_015374 [Nyssa sinensis]|uniref:Disease resistance N-terminal domain-containing protein n=1 Tax=Nyssa sinensis TaxID=561372 RepID=A0A5J4ZH72_9ASTE|nr:hypothetical protein F0562_015374 [Nyssa sinensis]